ncbi:MAG: hypothetical protein Q7R92_05625 [bacterium]|nr:hypothetical protein [bacterium]
MEKNLEKIIEKSGNNLHIKVVELLESLKWDVELSSYYYDDTTGKPREIDIVAKKRVDINFSGNNFFIFLFIECKYFKNEIAFRLHRNDKDKSKKAIILNSIYQDGIFTRTNSVHHYLVRDKISKLYDSSGNSDVFLAFTQAAKSLLFFKYAQGIRGIYYPLVVYGGVSGIYEIENVNDLNNKQSVKHSIFGFDYWYRWREENAFTSQYFCVDFLHFDVLKDFIEKTLETEKMSIIMSESR